MGEGERRHEYSASIARAASHLHFVFGQCSLRLQDFVAQITFEWFTLGRMFAHVEFQRILRLEDFAAHIAWVWNGRLIPVFCILMALESVLLAEFHAALPAFIWFFTGICGKRDGGERFGAIHSANEVTYVVACEKWAICFGWIPSSRWCTRMDALRCEWTVKFNNFSSNCHIRAFGFEIVGITMCDFSDPFCVNALPQMVHTYGLYPSWEIMWRVKLVPVLNSLLHLEQKCPFRLALLLLFIGDLVFLLRVLTSVDCPASDASAASGS